MPHIQENIALSMLSYLSELKKKGEFHPNDQNAIANIIHEILTSTEFEIKMEDFKTEFEKKWNKYKYPDDWKRHTTCPGCREGQPNQLAHCNQGGCLYLEEIPE
tara:strand:- start:797 stop:1108 length:312 start_codon:yes stop_codon:yes gene_type:complete